MSILYKFSWLLFSCVVLVSCDVESLAEVGATEEVGVATSGVAKLSWESPIKNVDDSVIDDLAGYKIYYGEDYNNLTLSVTINDETADSYTIENLSSQTTYYFAITSFNSMDIESALSNIVAKAMN